MTNHGRSVTPAIVYRCAELFIRDKRKIAEIANQLNIEFPGAALTREAIYPLLSKARESGFLRLIPPFDMEIAAAIEAKFRCRPGSIRVVDCPIPSSNEAVSEAAAELTVGLVREIGGTVDGPVGIGLGPGRATLDFARHFSQLMREEHSIPLLNLVAISAGCPAEYPEYSSISFFNLFSPSNVARRIGLFAETLIRCRDFDEIKNRSGVREAFAAKAGVHIVVTSMGDASDPHALFRIFHEQSEEKPKWLDRCIGDIQYRPYSVDGPLVEAPGDLRPVTVFEIEELTRLAREKDRHVILIARQCWACAGKSTRAKALLPILRNENLRVFSRLVIDSPTANELLAAK